jgi:hypothetical protein
MNINRHNYEEYFILYMDNELSNEDRRSVEEFVVLHPDLKEELDILLQSKLVPDNTISFEGKEELLQFSNPSLAINMSNYEEWVVLYMDNELNDEERAAVEKFAANNPAAKDELNLLQKTKLQPETIVFANKESLYRREEKVRRLPVWRRVAAAAAILVAVGITAVVVSNNKPGKTDETVASNPTKSEQTTKEATGFADNNAQQATQPSAIDNNTIIQPEKINNAPVLANRDDKNSLIKEKVQNSLPVQVKKEDPFIANSNDRPSNNLPSPENNPYVNPVNRTNDMAIAQENVIPGNELPNNPQTKYSPIVTKRPDDPSVIHASVNNKPVIADDVDADQPDGKKNKLRGFFRKITRTFEKKTGIDATDDDDRLLVAGLAIKLK